MNISGRYVTNSHIKPSLDALKTTYHIEVIGTSFLGESVYSIKLGSGPKRILIWSQMHGNESTSTKAIFDILNVLRQEEYKYVLNICTICIIPLLNPDGAKLYTRLTANKVDLNRDAQDLSQPESKILRDAFNKFKPHFCFNMHDQRSIFSSGNSSYPATVSFLSPSQDYKCSITKNRKQAMEIIGVMNTTLQGFIPNQVGRYDDAFNPNCVGDTFQSLDTPTILFEAGHYKDDYQREECRKFIFIALLEALDYIANNKITGNKFEPYMEIPHNKKLFFDLIIRNCNVENHNKSIPTDIAIQYKETLKEGMVYFLPIVKKISDLSDFYGHKEIDANYNRVLDINNNPIKVGFANDFVFINNELFSLKLNNN